MRIKVLVVGYIKTNCYLVVSGDEMIIIDPGGNGKKILREAKKVKVKPKFIINTHCHFDHTWANEFLQKETKAKILIHKAEKSYINFRVDKFLEDGDEIKIGSEKLKIIHTPGHTKGGMCLLGERIIFTGDTIFREAYGRTDLPGGSQEELINSLNNLAKIIKPGTTIYPGHGRVFKFSGFD